MSYGNTYSMDSLRIKSARADAHNEHGNKTGHETKTNNEPENGRLNEPIINYETKKESKTKHNGKNACPENSELQTKKKSAVDVLCDEAGYNREDLEGVELEAKLDVSARKRWNSWLWFLKRVDVGICEKISFPAPYYLDKVLGVSDAVHDCYGFLGGDYVREAFTKVTSQSGTKIKIKGCAEYISVDDVVLLKRHEEHKENLSLDDAVLYIAKEARKQDTEIKYVGSFRKQSKEAFVFNPVSGRIFVAGMNVCTSEQKDSPLYQTEIEYYGRVNGYVRQCRDVADEVAFLAKSVMCGILKAGYSCESSKLTKFDWLAGNVR